MYCLRLINIYIYIYVGVCMNIQEIIPVIQFNLYIIKVQIYYIALNVFYVYILFKIVM